MKVWQDTCEAQWVSTEADVWLSTVLGQPCRLAYMPEPTRRPVNPDYGQPGEIVGFADSCPLLVIGEASLADFNRRLPQPIMMDHLRPNIVFTGGQAYEEEQWEQFQIGGNRFRGIRACGRCKVINIDPQTAEIDPMVLGTLAGYRRQGSKVVFGLHASWSGEGSGKIAVGDQMQNDATADAIKTV